MGLDMYLSADKYVSEYRNSVDQLHEILEAVDVDKSVLCPVSQSITVQITVGYWRKANQIHSWFIQNCADGKDDCQPVYVPAQQLEELRDLCKRVLADHSLAEELLAPEVGFFFGSQELDDYYFEGLKDTVKILDKALSIEDVDYTYRASW